MSEELTDELKTAFISYSRDPDEALAADIKRSLQRLSNPWYQRRPFIDVVLDKASFGSSHDVDTAIYDQLDDADHLVLLLSKGSAESPWTNKEVAHWLKTEGGAQTISYAVTQWDGDLNDFRWTGADVPPALHGINKDHTPLAVDLRWARESTERNLKNERWASDVAQIAAHIKGVRKDRLVGDLVALRTRARLITGAVLLGLAILLVAIGVAVPSWLLARDAADRAEQDRVTAEASRDAAVEAETLALDRAGTAEALALAAETAQAEAEGLRDQAQAALGTAQEDLDQAVTGRDQAIAAQAEAETAQSQAELAQTQAERAQATAEAAQRTAEQLATDARVEAAVAQAAAIEADQIALGRQLNASALQNAGDDPQAALALAAAGYCQVTSACTDGIDQLRFDTQALGAADLEELTTLLEVSSAARGTEQYLTGARVVAAAISADGDTVVIAVRPAAGNDTIRRYQNGVLAGAVTLDSWTGAFDLEIQSLALSEDGERVAALAWPAGGISRSAQLGYANLSSAIGGDIGPLVDLGGTPGEYPHNRLVFQPGSRRHLLLQSHRIDIVCCSPDANVHVLMDLDAPTPGVLSDFLDNGYATFTENGNLLAVGDNCVEERTVPGQVPTGSGCVITEEGLDVFGELQLQRGAETVDYTISLASETISINDAFGGLSFTVIGEPLWLEVLPDLAELRVGFVDGTVRRWTLPDLDELAPVGAGRATSSSDREVVFSQTGAAVHHLDARPIGGWAAIGYGSGGGSLANGGFAVIGGEIRPVTGAGRRIPGTCAVCAVAVSDNGETVVFANGIITDGSGTVKARPDVPDGFSVEVAVSSNGRFVAFAQNSIQSIPPTQDAELIVVDLDTGERWSRSGFLNEPDTFVLGGLTNTGTALAVMPDSTLVAFAPGTDDPYELRRFGQATAVVDVAVVGDSAWVIDSTGVITEISISRPGPARPADRVRVEREGFSAPSSLGVTSDGAFVAIGLANGTVEIWIPGATAAAATGLASIDPAVAHVTVTQTPTGLSVMASGEDQGRTVVGLQPVDPTDLLAAACAAANRSLTTGEWLAVGGTGTPVGC